MADPRRTGSELSHVCAGGDLNGELGIQGLGETVKHLETRYGAASFKPGYGRLGHPGGRGELSLAPTTLLA
jgi:hypothetical protein